MTNELEDIQRQKDSHKAGQRKIAGEEVSGAVYGEFSELYGEKQAYESQYLEAKQIIETLRKEVEEKDKTMRGAVYMYERTKKKLDESVKKVEDLKERLHQSARPLYDFRKIKKLNQTGE